MTDSQLAGSALVALGVIIIVIGAGLMLDGHNQQKLAEAWVEQKNSECFAYVVSTLPLDASPEEMDRAYSERCGGPYRTNPYAGGGLKVLAGLIIAFTGGYITTTGYGSSQ